MNSKWKEAALSGVCDALRLFPFSMAVGVCSGFGFGGGCVAASVCLVSGAVFGHAFLPSWWVLLPIFFLCFQFGTGAACAALVLGGVWMFLLSLLPREKRSRFFAPPVRSGFLLAAAFSTTALQTTNYFGIGAVGGTVPQILRDYISLGFHPNWRGILYGTIVMVVLITYPRKFKKLSQKLPAAFAALLLTFPLHRLLVPHAEGSPIDEVGIVAWKTLFDGAFLRGTIPHSAIPAILCAGLSLAFLATVDLSEGPMRALSVASMGCGILGGVPVCTDGTRRTPFSTLICACVTALLYACPGLSRMPVHALAVILIVTAWQDVPWGKVAQALRGGIGSVLLWVCSAVCTVVLGVHYAVPLLAAMSVLFYGKEQKEGCN